MHDKGAYTLEQMPALGPLRREEVFQTWFGGLASDLGFKFIGLSFKFKEPFLPNGSLSGVPSPRKVLGAAGGP